MSSLRLIVLAAVFLLLFNTASNSKNDNMTVALLAH